MVALPVGTPPYRVEVRDPARARVGQVDRLTNLELVPRYNAVGGWTMKLPAGTAQAALLQRGGWVSISADSGTRIFDGWIAGRKTERSESAPHDGTLTVYGPSADKVLLERLAVQVPGQPVTNQSGAAYDRRSGAGETVIKAYVNLNAGPGAVTARETPGLVIESDLARGSNVKASARMSNLLDLITPLAQSAGLGFRVVFNTAGELEFRVFVPVDRTGTARFAFELGNLVEFTHTEEAARATVAVVGDADDLTARVFREVIDTAAIALWGNRAEVFVDKRDVTDTDELDQAGAEAVVEGGPVDGLSMRAVDTPNLAYAVNYHLGDRVTVAGVADVLREVKITWDAESGALTESTVGTATTTGTPRMIARLLALTRKVDALQAKK